MRILAIVLFDKFAVLGGMLVATGPWLIFIAACEARTNESVPIFSAFLIKCARFGILGISASFVRFSR